MKRILITGASGFIGSFLVEKAIESGWEIWAGIRRTSNREYLSDEKIHFIDLNFSDKEILKQQIKLHTGKYGKWDYVVHNAGVTKCLDLADFEKVNYNFTVNFINALRETNNVPEKFVLMSSLSALKADTYYGRSKRKAEQYLESMTDFPYLIFRPTGVYGPREKDYFMMLKTVNSGLDVRAGFKPQYLTFVYVTDLVNVIFLSLGSDLNNKIYAVSDDKTYTDEEYAKLLQLLLKKKFVLKIKIPLFLLYIVSCLSEFFAKISGKTSTLNRDKYRIMEQRDWTCNIQPLKDDLGYHAEYDLKHGLEVCIDWYRKNNWI